MKYSLTLRFLGVLRLLAGRQLLELPLAEDSITLQSLLTELNEHFGTDFAKEAQHQLILLSPSPGEPGQVLNIKEDGHTEIPSGHCVTFVTPPAGG